MEVQVDVVVLGAGASGASLVSYLAAAGWRGRLLVIDAQPHPLAHQAWAYWSDGSGLLDPLAAIELASLDVHGTGFSRRLRPSDERYRVIDGPVLATAMAESLGDLGGDLLHARATAVVPESRGATVHAVQGRQDVTIRARWVFDSAGLGASRRTAAAHLDALGWAVSTQEPTFDPSAVTLMDFRTPQEAGPTFCYVLPRSSTTALVERTCFLAGAPGDPGVDHRPALESYLAAIAPDGWRVTGGERAIIPLHTAHPRRPRGAVVAIGARAGRVKASTGYGFARIQSHSAALAASMAHRGDPHAVPRDRRWPRLLDAALLRVVRAEPEAVLDVFEHLVTGNPADRVLDFPDEKCSLAEQLAVAATLPLGGFARAVGGLRR